MKYLDPKFKDSDKETAKTETDDQVAEEVIDERAELEAEGVAEAETASDAGVERTPQIPPSSGWEAIAERGLSVINLIAIAGGILISLNLLDPGPLRAIAATILVTTGPGTGLVRLLNRFDVLVQYVFAIGVSVSISVLTAQVLLSLGSIGVLEAAIPLTVIAAIRPITWLIKSVMGGSRDRKSKTAQDTQDRDGLNDEHNEGKLEP